MAPSRTCGWQDGRDKDTRCDCPGYVARSQQDSTNQSNFSLRCQDCGHFKSWHGIGVNDSVDDGVVAGIMKQYDAELSSIPRAKATKAEAASEAFAGLQKDVERSKAFSVRDSIPHMHMQGY